MYRQLPGKFLAAVTAPNALPWPTPLGGTAPTQEEKLGSGDRQDSKSVLFCTATEELDRGLPLSILSELKRTAHCVDDLTTHRLSRVSW